MLKPACAAATLMACLLTTTAVSAEQRYVVKRGDSLSKIAAQQLGSASRWREIWALNPSIRRPEQLAAGATLRLPSAGETAVAMNTDPASQGGNQQDSIETDPAYQLALEQIRSSNISRLRQNYRLLDNSGNAVHLHAVRHEQDGLYLYSSSYTQQLSQAIQFGIFEPSAEPATSSTTELMRIGSAKLALQKGALAGFHVTSSLKPPQENALLLPLNTKASVIEPHYPAQNTNTRVLKALYEQAGGYILLLDKGVRHGLAPGTLLRLHQRNPVESEAGSALEFPGHAAGWAMVFEAGQRLSFALVLSAQRTPAAGDRLH